MSVYVIMFFAYAIALLFQWLDSWTTDIGSRQPGGREANPIIRFVLIHFGLPGMYILKCMILPLAFVFISVVSNRWSIALLAALAVSGAVGFIHNYIVLRKAGVKVFG